MNARDAWHSGPAAAISERFSLYSIAHAGFATDYKINWYRCPIDKALLGELMQRNDLRGWLQTLAHLGLFFATGALAYIAFLNIDAGNWPWSVPLLLVALFAHGTIGPFMGLIAVHELQHRTVFKSRALNAFFEKFYAFLSWSDYIWYQESHAIHHQATCHADYDGEVPLPIRFSLRRWRVWLGLLAWDPANTWQRLKSVWRHANGRSSAIGTTTCCRSRTPRYGDDIATGRERC